MGPETLHIERPLTDEELAKIVSDFDGANINSSEGHWWDDCTDEDKPSHPSNVRVDPDGSFSIRGVDFTEGRVSRFLAFNAAKTKIEADIQGTSYGVKKVLGQIGIGYSDLDPAELNIERVNPILLQIRMFLLDVRDTLGDLLQKNK